MLLLRVFRLAWVIELKKKKSTQATTRETKEGARSRGGDHSDLSRRRLERRAVTQPNEVCFVCLSQDLYFVTPQRRI